jgi:hypothetical protein
MEQDLDIEIPRGKVSGTYSINKFGVNPQVDTGTIPEDIWDGGGIYVPPTQDQIHDIASSSAADVGTLKSTGTITEQSITKVIDSNATFVTDGVAVNDVVLNDTSQDHSIVLSVDSETQLTVEEFHHGDGDNVGNTYRIVNPSGTGTAVLHIRQGFQKANGTITEFVIMNGTTPVPTINEYYRITRMHGHGSGSNKTNVGTITCTASVDATVTAQINPKNGQTQMAFIYIPYGETAYVKSYYATIFRTGTASQAMARIYLMSNLWGKDHENLEHAMGVSVDGGMSPKKFSPNKKITQGTDLWLRVHDVSDSASIIDGGFDVIVKREA